ncbi:SDR family oxidoreductase [Desulfatibacillum aliphaticivorans]|uniref:SDR family oxidoreductase n=1 Tax=Desulfatibacillum aliphaticivorans TaxID=218208 RepID=UPI00040E5C25|nr:SDR family oxidoreductase [Desulfatibacillum aliphaticivorans]
MDIKNKKAMVTGAASGIGRATAMALAAKGAVVFITDINEAGLKQTAKEIESRGGSVGLAKALDISDYEAVSEFAQEIHQEYEVMDILVNNAGVALFAQPQDYTMEDWRRIIDVNLWGVINGIQCFMPEMVKKGRGGHIVNVSSTAGLFGLPWHLAYCASKHGVVGISEVLKYDLHKHGIKVTVVCPGAVNTGILESVQIKAPVSGIDKLKDKFRKIALTPEKVGGQIVRAIEKNQYMLITSGDIKALYFFKTKCFLVYHGIMRLMTRIMDKGLGIG